LELDLKRLRELAKLLHQFDLSELDVRLGEMRVRLRRGGVPAEEVVAHRPARASSAPADAHAAATPAPAATSEEDANVFYVTSPFVGTFYRAPSPEAPSFVDVGATVTAGQVLCIIEAMKLMNEIEADQAGRVLECLVENGKPVEYGQRLFRMARL
jgi:acetyl-CoA carboxylase biotin carboxyl carrier protein